MHAFEDWDGTTLTRKSTSEFLEARPTCKQLAASSTHFHLPRRFMGVIAWALRGRIGYYEIFEHGNTFSDDYSLCGKLPTTRNSPLAWRLATWASTYLSGL